jgi:hypothetical protein
VAHGKVFETHHRQQHLQLVGCVVVSIARQDSDLPSADCMRANWSFKGLVPGEWIKVESGP